MKLLKSFLLLVPVLWLTGCATTQFTRLTPLIQPRNANNLYHVEVAFDSQLQALRWDSIKAYALVNGTPYPLRPEPQVPHRWEGYVPIPPDAHTARLRFKFDYLYNAIGSGPRPGSAYSPEYELRIVDQP
ncbi:MAG TPA: hypothetical protein VFB55_03235 [Verrucomicrobiae bacterium]|nr:hypothetical protein [Verrucomicrobiae bacterium]